MNYSMIYLLNTILNNYINVSNWFLEKDLVDTN